MSNHPSWSRRRFLGNAGVKLAAAKLAMIGSTRRESIMTTSGLGTPVSPGRHRTRSRRLREVHPRFRETDLADRLTDLEVRRRHIRPLGRGLRQPRPRGDRDPQLPLAAGTAEGEPKYDDFEKRLAAAPVITVPTITMEGDANGAPHPEASAYRSKFSGQYAHRLIAGGGHNLPQEAPRAFADAVIDLSGYR